LGLGDIFAAAATKEKENQRSAVLTPIIKAHMEKLMEQYLTMRIGTPGTFPWPKDAVFRAKDGEHEALVVVQASAEGIHLDGTKVSTGYVINHTSVTKAHEMSWREPDGGALWEVRDHRDSSLPPGSKRFIKALIYEPGALFRYWVRNNTGGTSNGNRKDHHMWAVVRDGQLQTITQAEYDVLLDRHRSEKQSESPF
jgi:hypothetical protein